MQFLADYGLFLAEAITIVVAIILTITGISAISAKYKHLKHKGVLRIDSLNDAYRHKAKVISEKVLSKKAFKQLEKGWKSEDKTRGRAEKSDHPLGHIFVIQFKGDIQAQYGENLRHIIDTILTTATPRDEVVIKIESPGGMVTGYGYAASQLSRIRDANIPLVACVDKVAASGGYMMAAVANQILAAPFAIVGSIGVIAQMPNFNRWLDDKNIDFEQVMAGEYKRTLTLFGKNTRKGREKFQEDIDQTHMLFKQFIQTYRTSLDIDVVATGEYWYGQDALDLRLIDEIKTSDDYLYQQHQAGKKLFKVDYIVHKSMLNRCQAAAKNALMQLRHPLEHL